MWKKKFNNFIYLLIIAGTTLHSAIYWQLISFIQLMEAKQYGVLISSDTSRWNALQLRVWKQDNSCNGYNRRPSRGGQWVTLTHWIWNIEFACWGVLWFSHKTKFRSEIWLNTKIETLLGEYREKIAARKVFFKKVKEDRIKNVT